MFRYLFRFLYVLFNHQLHQVLLYNNVPPGVVESARSPGEAFSDVCMCLCMMCICMFVYVYVYNMDMYMTWTCRCICRCICTCTCTCIGTCICIRICTCVCRCICLCARRGLQRRPERQIFAEHECLPHGEARDQGQRQNTHEHITNHMIMMIILIATLLLLSPILLLLLLIMIIIVMIIILIIQGQRQDRRDRPVSEAAGQDGGSLTTTNDICYVYTYVVFVCFPFSSFVCYSLLFPLVVLCVWCFLKLNFQPVFFIRRSVF